MDAGIAATARIAELSGEIEAMRAAVAALQPAPAADFGPIEAELQGLDARVAAIATGASSADAEAISASLAALQGDLAALGQSVAGFGGRIAALEAGATALAADLEAAKTTFSRPLFVAGDAAGTAALRLPILLTTLEAAFAAGTPYAAELLDLIAIQPDAAVPQVVADRAGNGLLSHQAIGTTLAAAVPDILAVRPLAPDAGWQDTALDWLKTLLAARPSGEVAGEAADAVVSQLEAAVARNDFAAAALLFAKLPEAMRLAAGDLVGEIEAQGAAAAFLAELRASILAARDGAPQ